jgi:hypothetical protein
MFIDELFTTAKTWKQHKMDEKINKIFSLQMEYIEQNTLQLLKGLLCVGPLITLR